MANTNPKIQDRAFNMKADDEFLEALDRVRFSDWPVLSKSDCVRKLVFDADRKAKRK